MVGSGELMDHWAYGGWIEDGEVCWRTLLFIRRSSRTSCLDMQDYTNNPRREHSLLTLCRSKLRALEAQHRPRLVCLNDKEMMSSIKVTAVK